MPNLFWQYIVWMALLKGSYLENQVPKMRSHIWLAL